MICKQCGKNISGDCTCCPECAAKKTVSAFRPAGDISAKAKVQPFLIDRETSACGTPTKKDTLESGFYIPAGFLADMKKPKPHILPPEESMRTITPPVWETTQTPRYEMPSGFSDGIGNAKPRTESRDIPVPPSQAPVPPAKPTSSSRKSVFVFFAAAFACVVAIAFLAIAIYTPLFQSGQDEGKELRNRPTSPSTTQSTKNTEPYTVLEKTQTSATTAQAITAPITPVETTYPFVGSWYRFVLHGEDEFEPFPEITKEVLEFYGDGTLKVGFQNAFGVEPVGWSRWYEGTWTLGKSKNASYFMTLKLTGGLTSSTSKTTLNKTISFNINGNSIVINKATGDDMQAIYPAVYTKDLQFETWRAGYDFSFVESAIKATFREYFYNHFSSNDKVCLADVTHDGQLDMLVIHFSQEEQGVINGYVFVWENRSVRQIYENRGGQDATLGFYDWFIKITPNGAILAESDRIPAVPYMIAPHYLKEYYLDNYGNEILVNQLDYTPIHELTAEAEQLCDDFFAAADAIKANYYTLHCEPECTEPNKASLGFYVTAPSSVFQ